MYPSGGPVYPSGGHSVSQWGTVESTGIQWRHSGVHGDAVEAQWRYSGDTVAVQWRYSGDTVAVQWETVQSGSPDPYHGGVPYHARVPAPTTPGTHTPSTTTPYTTTVHTTGPTLLPTGCTTVSFEEISANGVLRKNHCPCHSGYDSVVDN